MTTEPSSRAFAFARARASSLPPSRVDRVASSPARDAHPAARCRPRAAERRRVRRRIRSRARRAKSSTTTRRRLSSSPSSATPRARPRCGAPRSASPRSSRGDTSPSSPRARSGADASRYGEGCVVASPSPSSPSSPRLVSRRRPPSSSSSSSSPPPQPVHAEFYGAISPSFLAALDGATAIVGVLSGLACAWPVERSSARPPHTGPHTTPMAW